MPTVWKWFRWRAFARFGGRRLGSKTQQSSCVATLVALGSSATIVRQHANTNTEKSSNGNGNTKCQGDVFVDYDIMLAHVSLCHTANCNNGTLRVSPIWGLVANSYENLQLARAITVCLLCVFSVSTPFSSAVLQSSPESDITERTSAPATTQCCYILRLVGVPFPHYTAFEMKTYW